MSSTGRLCWPSISDISAAIPMMRLTTTSTAYNFWLEKLNQFNGNFVNAEMVKAFITSGEYRHRFGP